MIMNESAKKNGYASNKDVKFKNIDSIYIEKFRTLVGRTVVLGKNITLISGKNGTMKSSILGLIAHPFSSPNDAKDVFGKSLKTDMRNVFRMSLEKDTTEYKYFLNATTSTDKKISESVRMYPRLDENRHRITVSLDNQAGSGNFLLNTAYINLKRLFPIIDTKAEVFAEPAFTSEDKQWISEAYLRIMTREAFTEFDCISDYKEKNTLGPKNASYDFNSISSGEDNLGNILMKMLAFTKYKISDDVLQGMFCIDEIEASLHPVALTNLFDFLLKWSEINNIQIIATTHSLYLIDHALKYQARHATCKEKCALNIISTALVGDDYNFRILNNPTYKDAYKELTLKNPEDEPVFKVSILCEDEIAIKLLKKIISSRAILNNIEFISGISGDVNNPGTSCASLIALGKNGSKLLEDSIIILDSDVSKVQIIPVKNKNVDIFIIPDSENSITNCGFAIEKDILKYASSLPGDHSFFKKFGEKAAFLDRLHRYDILETGINQKDNITKYKNWYNDNKATFNTLLPLYVKDNKSLFDIFKGDLLAAINKKRTKKGLPLLSF